MRRFNQKHEKDDRVIKDVKTSYVTVDLRRKKTKKLESLKTKNNWATEETLEAKKESNQAERQVKGQRTGIVFDKDALMDRATIGRAWQELQR